MKHRFWNSILAVPLLLAACGTTNVASSNDPRAELLALHEEAMRAHWE